MIVYQACYMTVSIRRYEQRLLNNKHGHSKTIKCNWYPLSTDLTGKHVTEPGSKRHFQNPEPAGGIKSRTGTAQQII